ncbi:MAG: ATP-binding cassette domain-containing protein [Acidimicrobiales bacterium]
MSADLVVENLTVEYTSADYVVKPVDHFGCRVVDGSLALLLGPSGSGKTTLLSCLAGILQPTAGSIRHDGREITALEGAELAAYRRRGVGIVFQAFNLVPSLDARDNVMLPLRVAKSSLREARRRADELLDEVDLTDRRGHLPSELSGGQQQRVAIARALALDPPLLLADEPTAHLDYVQVETTLRILRRLTRPGRVLVVVTHDDRLLPLADQVVELVPHRPLEPDGPVDVRLKPAEVLFRQGDASDLIYIVDEGEVEIFRETVSGGLEILDRRGPDQCFGEMGPLFGLPRSASVRARSSTRLTGYSVSEFREALGLERLDGLVRAGAGADGRRINLRSVGGAARGVNGRDVVSGRPEADEHTGA